MKTNIQVLVLDTGWVVKFMKSKWKIKTAIVFNGKLV